VIEVTGTRNKASGGSWVWVDGFSVTASPTDDDEPSRRDGRPRLIEQTPDGRRGRDDSGTDPREARVDMSWSGAWSTNRLKVHEGAEARLAMDPAAKASFSFVGSGVRWIGYQDEWSGIADVFVDGKLRATVDTYASPAKARSVLFAADDLDDRPHTLTIQPTGRRRKVSGGSWIWIDEVKVVR
jgi:hypothetical protein